MGTRSNAGRGFTTGRGVKTHHQVFEEHIRGDTRDNKLQFTFDRDQSGQRTGFNLRESRISNRIKNIALNDRRTKRTGRGYTSQDWIKHHRKIVERTESLSEKGSENEQIAKSTEVLTSRQKNSDQKEDRTKTPTAQNVDTGVESTEEGTDDALMAEINVCMSRLEKLPNDRKIVKIAGQYTDTTVRNNELSVLAEVHVKSSNDRLEEIKTHTKQGISDVPHRYGELSSHQVINEDPPRTTGTDTNDGTTQPNGNMEIEILSGDESANDQMRNVMKQVEKQKAVTTVGIKKEMLDEEAKDMHYGNETTADTDTISSPTGEMEIEILSVNESDNDPRRNVLQQGDKQKAVTTVVIKKEMLDEEAKDMNYGNEQTADTDTSSGSVSVATDWEDSSAAPDTYMSDSDSSDSTSEYESNNTVDQSDTLTAATVKRKSTMYESNKKKKKVHFTCQKVGRSTDQPTDITMNEVDANQTGNVTSNEDCIPVGTGEGETNGTDTCNENKHEKNRTNKSPTTDEKENNNMVPEKGTNFASVNHNSDEEWKEIAEERKRIISSTFKKGTKVSNQHSRATTKHKYKNQSMVRLVTSTRDSEDILQVRGQTMIEKRQLLRTPIRIEFNLDSSLGEFNIIHATTELFGRMFHKDNTIRVLQTETNITLWEDKMQLPEDKEFTERFKLKEQTFRKGSKKITIYCVLN